MSGTTNTLSPPAPAPNGAKSPHQVSVDQVDRGNNRVPNSDRGFISWTQLSTFRQCPLRYYFRYVERLPEEFVASSLLFGSGIHAAAELHYRRLLAGDSPPDIDEMLGAFWDEWNERSETEVRFGKTESVDSIAKLIEPMFRAFQASEVAVPDGRVIGIEEELIGPIAEGCPPLLGKIDLLLDRGDELVVMDLKTARSRWSRDQAESSAEQLLLYSELAKQIVPGKQLRLQFAVVTKAKSPAVQVHEIQPSKHRVARTQYQVQEIWRAIQAGVIYANPSPMNCHSCPYVSACKARIE